MHGESSLLGINLFMKPSRPLLSVKLAKFFKTISFLHPFIVIILEIITVKLVQVATYIHYKAKLKCL